MLRISKRAVLALLALWVCITVAIGVALWDRSPQAVAAFPHVGPVESLTFSPDGKHLLAGSKGVTDQPDGMWQGQLIVWEVATGEQVASLSFPQWVRSLSFSPDGKRLAVACASQNGHSDRQFEGFEERPGEVRVYDFPVLQEQGRLTEGTGVLAAKFSPDGKTLATCSRGLTLWDAFTLKQQRTLTHFAYPFASITFVYPDGKLLAVGDADSAGRGSPLGVLKLFNAVTGEKLREFAVPYGPVRVVEASPDGSCLAVLNQGAGPVTLWETATGLGATSPEFSNVFNSIQNVAFSADNKLLGATKNRGVPGPWGESGIVIWDLQAQRVRAQWKWSDNAVLPALAFSPDGKLLAVGTTPGPREPQPQVKLFAVPGS
jgi:WD40 repeat protein